MKRKYGEEQRKHIESLLKTLVDELESTYLNTFEKLDKQGLGEGQIAKLTQLMLISREAAIRPLINKIMYKED